MSKLEGKIVVVTGGAEGIGYNIADKYLQHNVKAVIILDINKQKGEEAVKTLNVKHGNKAVFIECDVRKDLEVVYKQIVDMYKNIDVLVNNAGISDENSVSKTIGINLVALMEWSMKVWEHMRRDKGGKGGTVLNIASMAGFVIDPFMIYYKTSKFAVVTFTKSLGHEYNFRRSGVRVIALCPGMTYTTLTTKPLVWDEHAEEFQKTLSVFPWQQAEDVGNAALEIMEKAPSGTAWAINGNQPIFEAPDCIKLTMENLEHPETIRI